MSLRDHASPLRVANFRYFFLGEIVNSAGSSMSGIALAFAVLRIDDSATALGWVAAAWTVPELGSVALCLLVALISATRPAIKTLRLEGPTARQPASQ